MAGGPLAVITSIARLFKRYSCPQHALSSSLAGTVACMEDYYCVFLLCCQRTGLHPPGGLLQAGHPGVPMETVGHLSSP
eukprot:scaffold104281_cov39-Prasinocladus_malaysianus.AAC.2